MLIQTLRVSLDILRLRRGPQDLPSSWNLLLATTGGYMAVNSMPVALLGGGILGGLLGSALVILINAGFTHVLLMIWGFRERFVQSFTALMATTAMLVLALVIVELMIISELKPYVDMLAKALSALPPNSEPEQVRQVIKGLPSAPGAVSVGFLALVTVNVWSLLVTGHIYRHALETSFVKGLALAFLAQLLLLVMVLSA